MKETGIVRRLDELGRIVIPKEIRTRLKIIDGDLVDICIDKDSIILKKYNPLELDINVLKASLYALKNKYQADFILFNNMKVLISTVSNISENELLNKDATKRIESLLCCEQSAKISLMLVDGILLERDFYIYPIDSMDSLYICILDNIISKKQKEIIEVFVDYFNIYKSLI